jgi:TP901 family phage tail tape measure protein
MSTGPAVATATVRIIPDTTGFRAMLEAEILAATKGVSASISTSLAAAASAPNVRNAFASQASSADALTKSIKNAGNAGAAASTGLRAASAESNALRGALIGLSRVTPVTVFGLGVYGVAAIAAGLAIKSAISSTADFEHQLYTFQAVTEATAAEMAAISERAKALGADLSLPSTSAGDAALAMTELAKGGLSVQDTLDASRGTLQLAAAAQIDVGTAAQFVVTELNAFGLAGTQATHIADLLAGASIAAQGDIRDFGTAFQQVSAVSRQVGLSVEGTTGALTELAKAGLKGADSGTSLRTFLLRLTPTTKQAQQYMDALGISYDKTRTVGSQLGSILDQLNASTSALNESQKTQALTQIFGQDAIRSASILIREGSAGLEENTAAANKSGAANRLAQANAQGLSGALNGLKSNLDTLGITLGSVVKGPITDFLVIMGQITGAVTIAATALTSLKIPDWLGGKQTSNILKNAKDALLFYPLVRRVYFPKKDIPIPETPAEKKARLKQAATFGGQVGGFSLADRFQVRPGEDPFAKPKPVPALSPAAAAAVRARIAALNKAKRKPLPGDTNAPNKLQIEQLNAQLAGDLQAELSADKKIEQYFKERKKLAVKGTNRYVDILNAEQGANSAARSVQDQIDANAAAATAEQKARAKERERLRKEKARLAKKELDDAAATARLVFNLQKSRLDLRIAAAGLTTPIGDDIRANRAEIRFYNAQIKRIEAIRKKRKLTLEEQQAVVDYRTAIIGLRSTIQGLKEGQGGGFSLQDLFKEASSQFNEFASNVSGGQVTSPGGVRGALSTAILAQKPKKTQADIEKLDAVGQTNSYLKEILMAIQQGQEEKPTGRHFVGGVAHGKPTAAQSKTFAKLHAR